MLFIQDSNLSGDPAIYLATLDGQGMKAGVHLQGTYLISRVVPPFPRHSLLHNHLSPQHPQVRYSGLKLCRVRNETDLEFFFIKITTSSCLGPCSLSSSSLQVTHLLPGTHLHFPGDSLLSHLGPWRWLPHTPRTSSVPCGELCWRGRLGAAVAKAHCCRDLPPPPPPQPEKVSLAEEASSNFPPAPQVHSFTDQQLCITSPLCSRNYSRCWETPEKKEQRSPPCSTYSQSNPEAPNSAPKHSATGQSGSQTFISYVNNR